MGAAADGECGVSAMVGFARNDVGGGGTGWEKSGRRRQRFFATVDLNPNRTKRNTEKSAGPNIYLLLHTSHVDFVPQSPKTRSDRPNNCSFPPLIV